MSLVSTCVKYPHYLSLRLNVDAVLPAVLPKVQTPASDTLSSAALADGASSKKETAIGASESPIDVNVQYLQALQARYAQLSSDERSKWNGVYGKYQVFLKTNAAGMGMIFPSPMPKGAIESSLDAQKCILKHQTMHSVLCFVGDGIGGNLLKIEVEALYKTCVSQDVRLELRSLCASQLELTVAKLTDDKLIDFLFALVEAKGDSSKATQMEIIFGLISGLIVSMQNGLAALSAGDDLKKDDSKSDGKEAEKT